jgi:2-polyprenyl-3-methyl-5-hydroxy-6-metoxy-1,4-benzoquinol methylase
MGMPEDTRERFDAGAVDWSEYNQQPLGRIRQEVTWRNLIPHLPPVSDRERPPQVLDAGGGSGELVLRFAAGGYRVWLIDYAPAMLEQARLAAQSLAPDARARLTLENMAAEDAPLTFAPGTFDVITCHTLIEYLPDPASTLRSLAHLLREGGLMSVSFVNRHAEVFRKVRSAVDLDGLVKRLEKAVGPSGFCATLFEIPGQAFGVKEVAGWLAGAGLAVAAECGIRVFADWLPGERLQEPDVFDALLCLEIAAATRDPYYKVARYLQLIAHRKAGPEPPTLE